MNNKFLPIAYLQNQFIPFSEAKISIATHALHYGTGAFGGLRGIYKDKQISLFRLNNHSKRLSQSAKFLGFNLDPKFIQDKIIEFIINNKPTSNIYIRPLIYTSDLGIAPRLHNIENDFLIYGMEFDDYFEPNKNLKLCFSSWQRQSDASLPLRGKITGAYITSSLAKTEAVSRGFDEAIFLNEKGKVCEATGMNIFIVRDGKLITPQITDGILEGITRKTIIEIASLLNIEVQEREIDKTELLIADEVFLCGTAAKIAKVGEIEQYKINQEYTITNNIINEFNQIISGKSTHKIFENYITKVNL
jgi:branched-chain amino acid aminotransferase